MHTCFTNTVLVLTEASCMLVSAERASTLKSEKAGVALSLAK